MQRLAAESAATEDALGWFDRLYTTAGGDAATIPWADLQPNPAFVQWAESHGLDGNDGKRRALVVGCGLGDDAEALATIGFEVTAFDISPTAVEWAKRRFPATRVSYVTADLLAPPAEWSGGFDFVLEIYTLQVLPAAMRSAAIARLGELVAPGGALLVIARGRDEDESAGEQVPWKLARSEFQPLIDVGLVESSFNNFFDNEDPPVRRFRAVYTRPPTPSR